MTWAVDYTSPASSAVCFRNPLFTWITTLATGMMKGWVGLVDWAIADSLPTKWSPVQQAGKVHRSKISVLPLCYAAVHPHCLGLYPLLDPVVKDKLFQAYYSSHYGSELWNLNSNKLSEYCAAWLKGLRRILELPNRLPFAAITCPLSRALIRYMMNCVFFELHLNLSF